MTIENEPDKLTTDDQKQPENPVEQEVLQEPEAEIEDAVVIEAPEDTSEPQPEDAPVEPMTETQPAPAAVAPVVRKGGFLPVVFGGLIAGGIGYGVSWYQHVYLDDGDTQKIVMLEQSVQSLTERLDAQVDPQALVEAAIGAELGGLRSEIAAVSAQVESRIDEIVDAPRIDGTIATSTFEEYRDQMIALQAEVAAQETRIQQLAAQAAEELEQARSAAILETEQARETAEAAAKRVAIAQVQTAIEAGLPFAEFLPDLEQAIAAPAPEALVDAASGVSTLAELQEAFAPTAREALALARAEGVAGEQGGSVGGFLRNMFDVRSVEPRDGTDVDAILSRAEAAVRTGRLSDALAELDALPDVVQTAMIGWSRQAQKRVAAVSALNELSLTSAE